MIATLSKSGFKPQKKCQKNDIYQAIAKFKIFRIAYNIVCVFNFGGKTLVGVKISH